MNVYFGVIHVLMLLLFEYYSIQDIYLFGGKCTSQDGTVTSTNEIHKLSIGKSNSIITVSTILAWAFEYCMYAALVWKKSLHKNPSLVPSSNYYLFSVV